MKSLRKYNMDRILSYMFLMIKMAKNKNVGIKKADFMNLGKDVIFLKGVKLGLKGSMSMEKVKVF
ncbi:MAG: hypothetical protein ACLU5J_04650 [Christensenellales bacterium]